MVAETVARLKNGGFVIDKVSSELGSTRATNLRWAMQAAAAPGLRERRPLAGTSGRFCG